MKLSTLKIMVEARHPSVRKPCAVASICGSGWCLYFRSGDLDPKSEGLESKRGGVRVFKTLDALAAVVSDLGYASFEVLTGVAKW